MPRENFAAELQGLPRPEKRHWHRLLLGHLTFNLLLILLLAGHRQRSTSDERRVHPARRLSRVADSTVERVKSLDVHQCLFKTLDVPGRFMKAIPFYEIAGNQ